MKKLLVFWIQIRTAQTYLTQNANNFFIRTPNWVIIFLLETRFRALSNPIGITFKFDEDINTIVTPTAPTATYTGPITRARTRQLNYQVLPFLGNDSNVRENMMLPKLGTFVLLTNEGPSLDKKDDHWSKIKHGDEGTREGNHNGVSSAYFSTLKSS